MSLNEFLEVLWRRKLIVAAVTVISIGVAVGALRLVTPQYEATSTVALLPSADAENSIFFFNVIDNITPVFADKATASTTLRAADTRLAEDSPLSSISVRTFEGTGLIDIKARDSDPDLAQQSAQAVTDVLLALAASGELRFPELRAVQLDRPTRPADPVFPRPAMTLAVALLLGLGFGVGAALLRENLTTKIETPEALARIAGVP